MRTTTASHVLGDKIMQWKSIFLILSLLFVISSCGKDNKTSSDQPPATPVPTTPPAPTPPPVDNYIPKNVRDAMNRIMSDIRCDQGARLREIQLHSTQNIVSNTTMAGELKSGHLRQNGRHVATYVGVNYGSKDLIFVTRMEQGAFNFTLSLCPYSFDNFVFIGPQTKFQNFQIVQGFNLDHDLNTGCSPIGSVDAGAIGYTASTSPFSFPDVIYFTKLCGDNF